MVRRNAFIRETLCLVLSFILMYTAFPGFSLAENIPWDCPECGRTGNTGHFCGSCAYPSPAPKSDLVEEVVSFNKLIRQYDTNYVKQFYDIRKDANKWISWTMNSAPQSLKELPLFPDFILPLYQSLTEASEKLHFEIEDTGNTYTVRSNIAEEFELISSDQYYNTVSPSYDKVMLLLEQNISGSADIMDIKMLDSSDVSISFSYPEGTSVRIEDIIYQFTYIYYNDVEEIITIDLQQPGSKDQVFSLNVRFRDADTTIDYKVFEENEMEIEIWEHSGEITGTEWLNYNLRSGELVYWDMDYYKSEDVE